MSSFQERQKSLFNTLKEAEEQCNFSKPKESVTPSSGYEIDKRTYRKIKYEMKQFRNKESIYKRPVASIRDCLRAKTIPDHIKNPQGWRYYSLSDVTPEQMSDATNTATALALLSKMEANEDKSIQDGDAVFKKPTFHLSARVKKDLKDEDEKIIFRSNKVIMPEYVVGVSKKKFTKVKMAKKVSEENPLEIKPQLKLSHLYNEDD